MPPRSLYIGGSYQSLMAIFKNDKCYSRHVYSRHYTDGIVAGRTLEIKHKVSNNDVIIFSANTGWFEAPPENILSVIYQCCDVGAI